MTAPAQLATPRKPRLTIDDHQTLRRPSEAVISPDGRRLAWSLPAAAYVDPADGAQAAIWMLDVGGEARQVTYGSGLHVLPRWAPTGDALAFASDRGHRGRLSLHVLRSFEGESAEIGEIAGAVEDVAWSRDGRRLLVLAADLGSDRAGSFQATRIEEHGAAEEDPKVTRPRQVWRRLLVVDAETGGTTEVGPVGWTVWEFDWGGEGLAAAIVSEDPTEGGWFRSSLVVIDLATRRFIARYDGKGQIGIPRLAPDGSRVAFVEGLASDRGDLGGVPMCARIEGADLRPAPLAEGLNVSRLAWVDERLAYAAWHGLHTACGFLSADGSVEEIWRGPATVGTRLCARVESDAAGKRLVAVYEASNEPPEVALLEIAGDRTWQTVTSFNAHLREFQLPAWREYRWTSSDGLELDGLLALPPDVDHTGLPLVVLVHGGPMTSWSHAWISDIPRVPLLWTAAGYAVFLPNPRGSRGYGQDFARANLGDMGGRDLEDVVAGVDALVADGLVDAGKIGVTGNSYGGFIAAMAIGKSDRFAAAVPMAVVSNWLSYHNTSNSGAFDELFLLADPYAPGGAYHECSPVVYARNVRTPTLIMQGELDLCTPVGQAVELYQAIAEGGQADVELVVFPREGHAYVEREHQREIWRRSRAWFDRYLLGPELPRA